MAEEGPQHFRQLVSGAPPETLAALGEALLALHRQRQGEAVDACPALRQAVLELTRWLVRSRSAGLNPEQRLFLASGAVAASVTVKDDQGRPVELELLPAAVYDGLLAGVDAAPDNPVLQSLLFPRRRWQWLADGELPPFDPARPGRYRPPAAGQPRAAAAAAPVGEARPTGEEPRPAAPPGHDAARLRTALAELRQQAGQEQQRLTRALRQIAESMRGERLAGVLKELAQFNQFTAAALEQLGDPARAAAVELPLTPERHPALMVVKELQGELSGALEAALDAQRRLLDCLARQQQVVRLVTALGAGTAAAGAAAPAAKAAEPPAAPDAPPGAPRQFAPGDLRRIETDHTALAQMMTQCLVNHAQRTAWSSGRLLLQEQLEKLGAPPEDCLAAPPALLASIARVQELHPDCFPLDEAGAPVLPPVVVEPGVGVVRWLDDRFLFSFVAADPPRPGPALSLSPLDQAVLRLYGGFLARGDIFNYRGERLADNFMAEYAGEVEQKVAVKFTGAEKKISYGTAAEEKDGASREDAVRDYMDFVYSAFNGLPLPKRVSARKAGVLLKYCLFRDAEFTTALALHLVAPSEPLTARAIIQRHTHHDTARAVALVQQALDASPVLQTRYRRDLAACLLAVFGHEFVDDARDAGLLGGAGSSAGPRPPGEDAPAAAAGPDQPAPPPEPAGRSYFDL